MTAVKIRDLRDPRKKDPKYQKKSALLRNIKQYGSTSTAHGLSYIAEDGRPLIERGFWILCATVAVLFTAFQMTQLYRQWKDDPVVTNLDTLALPIEEIEFPAITICPQGSMKEVMSSVLFKQLKEYIIRRQSKENNRIKRSNSFAKQTKNETNDLAAFQLSYEEMIKEAELFLEEVYPGAKENPAEMIHAMTAASPEKAIESETLLSQAEDVECGYLSNVEILGKLNKRLNNDSCPNGFETFEDKSCIHNSGEPMTYNDAQIYCNDQQGAQLLYFESYENFEAMRHYNLEYRGR